ncbi:MAG: glutathione S-transferase family protein [Pseudomonadota bacterium]
MADLTLLIGNKNLSSWSLRPWLVAKHFALPVNETKIRLDTPETYAQVKKHSPSGLVPCLYSDDLTIGDSLAIIEYFADLYPEQMIWPKNREERARARSMASEMHSGFSELRGTWPMDVVNVDKSLSCPPGVAKDLKRIHTLWTDAIAQKTEDGPFLFGPFGAVDAMFAPVVSRIRTYGPVPRFSPLKDYMEAVWELPAMKIWREGAEEEARDGWYD